MKNVTTGMDRAGAQSQLVSAWHMDECEIKYSSVYQDSRRDLFWFGSQDVKESFVVVVVYVPENSSSSAPEWVVESVDFVEHDVLWWFYHDCTSLDLSTLAPTVFPYK